METKRYCWDCAHMTQKCPCPATEGAAWDYCKLYKRHGKTKKECSHWVKFEEKEHQNEI